MNCGRSGSCWRSRRHEERRGAGRARCAPSSTCTASQMLGSKDAPVTMVEFTDYQCPFCQRFHTTVFAELKKNYIDTGKVRFYSRDLPLDQLHPNAIAGGGSGALRGRPGAVLELRATHGRETPTSSTWTAWWRTPAAEDGHPGLPHLRGRREI